MAPHTDYLSASFTVSATLSLPPALGRGDHGANSTAGQGGGAAPSDAPWGGWLLGFPACPAASELAYLIAGHVSLGRPDGGKRFLPPPADTAASLAAALAAVPVGVAVLGAALYLPPSVEGDSWAELSARARVVFALDALALAPDEGPEGDGMDPASAAADAADDALDASDASADAAETALRVAIRKVQRRLGSRPPPAPLLLALRGPPPSPAPPLASAADVVVVRALRVDAATGTWRELERPGSVLVVARGDIDPEAPPGRAWLQRVGLVLGGNEGDRGGRVDEDGGSPRSARSDCSSDESSSFGGVDPPHRVSGAWPAWLRPDDSIAAASAVARARAHRAAAEVTAARRAAATDAPLSPPRRDACVARGYKVNDDDDGNIHHVDAPIPFLRATTFAPPNVAHWGVVAVGTASNPTGDLAERLGFADLGDPMVWKSC